MSTIQPSSAACLPSPERERCLGVQAELVESLGEPSVSDGPEKLRSDFKTKLLKVSESCLRGTPGTSKSFLTKETRNVIEESRTATLDSRASSVAPGAEA